MREGSPKCYWQSPYHHEGEKQTPEDKRVEREIWIFDAIAELLDQSVPEVYTTRLLVFYVEAYKIANTYHPKTQGSKHIPRNSLR